MFCKKYLELHLAQYTSAFERQLVADVSATLLEPTVCRVAPESHVEHPDARFPLQVRPQLLATFLKLSDACEARHAAVPWQPHRTATVGIRAVRLRPEPAPATIVVEASYSSYESKKCAEDAISRIDHELAAAEPHLRTAGLSLASRSERRLDEVNPESLLSWTVLPRSVYRLLTEGMYNSRTVFLRELIQNSLDAIKIRHRVTGFDVDPCIAISIVTASGKDDSPARLFVIRDNGIGMDFEDIKERLIKIGSSVRDSAILTQVPDSDKARTELIARFGVGFVSVFAVARCVEVSTRKPEMTGLSVRFAAEDTPDGGFSDTEARVSRDPQAALGTRISVWLREDLSGKDVVLALEHYGRGWDTRRTAILYRICTERETQKWDAMPVTPYSSGRSRL